jgi:hypothetical protein
LTSLALSTALSTAPAFGASERHRIDARDLDLVRAQHPEAAALFEQAEAAQRSGKPSEADELLKHARAQAERSPLLARTHCNVQSELGRREAALTACEAAIGYGASPLDLRAMVGALMAGEGPVSSEDLRRATQQAAGARHRMPKEPWGYAAECDIAIRLRDQAMLSSCVGELERVAPGHAETVRARQALDASVPALRYFAGWGLVALFGAGTLLHALGRRRRRGMQRSVAVGTAAALALVVGSKPAHAQADDPGMTATPAAPAQGKLSYGLSQWPVDESDPERTVPTPEQRDSSPLQYGYHIMDLTDKAIAAAERGDHHAEARFYSAVAKAAPDRAVGFAKACRAFAAAGERDKAVAACTKAVARPGITVGDQIFFTRLFLDREGELSAEDIQRVETIIDHIGRVEAGKVAAVDLRCQLGVRLWDSERLERCTTELEEAAAPDDPRALQYRWALAMTREDHEAAQALLAKAKELGFPPDKIEKMEQGTRMVGSVWWQLTHDWRVLSLAGLVVLAGGGLGVFLLLRRRGGARLPPPSDAHVAS